MHRNFIFLLVAQLIEETNIISLRIRIALRNIIATKIIKTIAITAKTTNNSPAQTSDLKKQFQDTVDAKQRRNRFQNDKNNPQSFELEYNKIV